MLVVSPTGVMSGTAHGDGPVAHLGPKMGILYNDKPNAERALRALSKRLEELVGTSVVDTDRFKANEPVPDDIVKRMAESCDWVLVGNCD